MSDPIQVPKPEDIINRGIEKLLELKPSALAAINSPDGQYHQIFLGLRAQAALMLRRISDAVKNGRVKFAEGDALKTLLAEEFDVTEDLGPTKATGAVALSRTGFSLGVIRKGTKFARKANSSFVVPYGGAIYESTADVVVSQNIAIVPTIAQAAGPASNIISLSGVAVPTDFCSPIDTLFDPTLKVIQTAASGGSNGVSDDTLRAYAKAFFRGQYAPVEAAIRAGILKGDGTANVLILDDYAFRRSTAFVADATWSSNGIWLENVRARMTDELWGGFGARYSLQPVDNQPIILSATVTLVDNASFDFLDEISKAVQSAIQNYFDNRPDWHSWKTKAIRATVSGAHPRILTCPAASVIDYLTGSPLSEPVLGAAPYFISTAPKHFYLINKATQLNFVAPS